MYEDFSCPYCSFGMEREDINNQVHEDEHIGKWIVECSNCKNDFELCAEPSIDYYTYRIKDDSVKNEKQI